METPKNSITVENTVGNKKAFCYYPDGTVLIAKDPQLLKDIKAKMEEAIKYLDRFLLNMSK